MRAALSHEFKSIIPTYDERPRAKWIFENSVQNTVVVSRLFFTQEVGICRDGFNSLSWAHLAERRKNLGSRFKRHEHIALRLACRRRQIK